MFSRALFLLTAVVALALPARAGLTVDIHLYHDNYGYYFYPWLNTTTNLPGFPNGYYQIASPQTPTNGSQLQYVATNNTLSFVTGGGTYYGDFNSFLYGITNGQWSIVVTNGTTTTQYQFQVTATGFNSNSYGSFAAITFPANNQLNVPNLPTFTWTGPANWAGTLNVQDNFVDTNGNYNYVTSSSLAVNVNSWVPSVSLPNGTNNFSVNYDSNLTATVIASVPTNNTGQAISAWLSTAEMETSPSILFVAGQPPGIGTGHTNLAYYAFEDDTIFTADLSGHGNGIYSASGYGNGAAYPTNVPAAGNYACYFFNNGGSGGSWLSPNTNLLSPLAGSFSVALWLKTTQVSGSDTDDGVYGNVGLVSALNSASPNFVIPMSLTGGKLAFVTGGVTQDTLHSATSINTGPYVHLVVTRNQSTGQKNIYVNGALDASDFGGTDLLSGANNLQIGAQNFNGYNGEMDEIQFYSGVLSASDVAYLYNHPGTAVPDASGNSEDFNGALGTSNLNWSTVGDTSWFAETTHTYNGSPAAAQSGSVTNNQSSTLSLTVTGPGTLTFYWSSQDDCQNFDYEFDIDGGYENDIYCSQPWIQDGPYTIPAGQHTLSWTTYAYGDTDPTQAGFLDQVSYVSSTLPIITVNPFNQTNYPGYNVALLAAAATNSPVTWQWFKVGSASPIFNATNALCIPTNSGTAGVAGSYYAVASTAIGSANTTTAAVNFVSAPLPPDWSAAFKSPFVSQNDYAVTKDYYYGCITDTNGNLYTAALFDGNMTLTNGTLNFDSGTGGDAAAVVKQSPTGAPLWAVAITNNGTGSAQAYCVATAPGGGVYVTGDFNGTNWLGTNRLTDAGGGDIFLVRFDANGSNLWVKTFGSTNLDFVVLNTLTADPAGNVTFSALLGSGPVSIGSSNYNVVGQEGVLVQLDQTGAVRWSQLLPAEQVLSLTSSSGRLYASLYSATSGGTTNVVIGGVSNVTDRAWAIACLNGTNGQAIWVRGVGAIYGSANGNPLATGLTDDAPRLAVSGTNVFLTGVAYDSTASFGALTVNFGDVRGQYFARYDTNGNAQVATTYGSITTTPFAAVADAKGELYVSGDFDTYSIFGNDIIATPVATRPFNGLYFSQAFLAKFDRNGNPLWAREAVVSSYGSVNFGGIALATDGVWASGWTQSGYYPQIIPALFGTNTVYSDPLWISGGAGGSTSIVWYPGGVLAKVTDNAVAASPVTLLNATNSGANFQFQFLSESGFNHNILYRTNLAVGTWLTNSTVSGDGTVKTISLPYSIFSPSKTGFIRVSTQ
jgi:hypothetical protein